MKIVWDEPKRVANLEKHGLDFTALSLEFFLASVVIPAKDGRSKAIGRLRDGTVVVIFLTLGTEALSVISMRPARKDERSLL
ncbi:BrnT family toxin [Rhizobium sp. TRM96647]|uniref:BrnT family toxin n=1 Tax=unclassified Rhizobium TaxID=2613769 RepID=UPI0021E94817|nr:MULTISPECIES: BrnT family toxin [unclassified Rhizobium]MCV3738176.1 BrnT family toxin [Rhizobium sp. TRM96647]MCV3760075.1 BrnT family toxin [Rhizobium sp. TRM96650]